MTYEEAKEKALAKKKEGLKVVTDEIHLLYQSFIESGFTEDQAFELSNTYIRQTMFDNILQSNNKHDRFVNRTKVNYRDYKRRLDDFKEQTDD